MKKLLLGLAFIAFVCLPLSARSGRWIYNAGYKVASGTSAVLTLQNPSDSTNDARVLSVEVYLESSAGDVTIARDAVSIAAGTGLVENRTSIYHGSDVLPLPELTAKSGATVTGATSLPVARPIPAAGSIIIAYDDIELVPGEDFAVSVSADSTDSITVIVYWEEFPAE